MIKKSPSRSTRQEHDSLGVIEVPADRYWGAQTQRSLQNFPIGGEIMPIEIIHAFGLQKEAAATANMTLGLLDQAIGTAIIAAAREVAAGTLDDHFPLVVWQTGSGTQTHMNVNEVLARRATEIMGAPIDPPPPPHGVQTQNNTEDKTGPKTGSGNGCPPAIHPNDHCNMSQSSNDTFPTVMHIATVLMIQKRLIPALDTCIAALAAKEEEFADVIKVGRTHMQDATPLTLGQEFSGYRAQISMAKTSITQALSPLYQLAQGGTAVGTGLNADPQFAGLFARAVADMTRCPFTPCENRFAALAAHDSIVALSGALTGLASGLMKIANDLRWLASGPRSGIGEITLPANEPGSSIMPGKVNPTQCESITQICAHVLGNHTTITIAGSSGHLELNVFKPVIIYNLLQSIRLLGDGCASFTARCIRGVAADRARLQSLMERSLMLVTALSPHIGYDKAARIAKRAHRDNMTLRAAAIAAGVDENDFDRWVRPHDMIGPSKA